MRELDLGELAFAFEAGFRLRQALEAAMAGRGAFRRFKDVLLRYPHERERWFAFQNDRMRQRVLEWRRWTLRPLQDKGNEHNRNRNPYYLPFPGKVSAGPKFWRGRLPRRPLYTCYAPGGCVIRVIVRIMAW